ncbi:MAG: hypothetical protein ABIJ36_03180 [Patescibacteria group bacterium]
MSDKPKSQPQEPKPVQPVKPSENPGTPLQKNFPPIKPVPPSEPPGNRLPFNESKNGNIIKGKD